MIPETGAKDNVADRTGKENVQDRQSQRLHRPV